MVGFGCGDGESTGVPVRFTGTFSELAIPASTKESVARAFVAVAVWTRTFSLARKKILTLVLGVSLAADAFYSRQTLRPRHSTAMSSSLGVPVKLLHESLGHVITVEVKNGRLYRGKLVEGVLARIFILVPWFLIFAP